MMEHPTWLELEQVVEPSYNRKLLWLYIITVQHAHRLNLAVLSACTIMAFKNTESYIWEMALFFGFSVKQRLLDRAISVSCHAVHAKKLKDTCKTRWIQHIDYYAIFLELLPAMHVSL